MTVPVQTPVSSSIANGVTTTFPYEFKILAAEDLTVTVDGVVVTTGFSITGVGDDVGGNVVFDTAPANGLKVVRYLNPVLSRATDYQQFGDFLSPTVNGDFDRIWLALQYIAQAITRSIKLPVDTVAGQEITENVADRANKVITFDVDGNVTLKSGTELIPEVDDAVQTAIAAASSAQSSASSASSSASTAVAAAQDAVNTPVAAPTHSATSKTTPVDADELPIVDSAASWVLKKLTWENLKAALKTYFDTLYAVVTTITNDPTFAKNDGVQVSSDWVKGLIGGIRFGVTSFSSPYIPAVGETISRAHNLSVTPKAAILILECVIADAGYSVGDRTNVYGQWNGSAASPVFPFVDGANCRIKCASTNSLYVHNKSTGAAVTPAANAWKYAFIYIY